MPILAIGIWKNKGFTLLEILVVLFMIGIITGLAVLSVNHGEAEQLTREAQRLAALMALNQEEALLRGEQRGVGFTESGYQFYSWDPKNRWLPLEDSELLKAHQLPKGFKLQLSLEGRPVILSQSTDKPQVLLLSSGESSDFNLILTVADLPGYQLSGDATGQLSTAPVP